MYGVGMETPMVLVRRTFPTWTVEVDGKAKFSGIWRHSVAMRLAAAAAA